MHDLREGTLFRPGDIVTDRSNNVPRPEQFEIVSYLGKGGFAECFAARSISHNDRVAIKVVEKAKLKSGSHEKMQREIRLHLKSRHRNIVRLHCAFESDRFHFLLLELCKEQSLLAVLNRAHATRGFMHEDTVRHYLRGTMAAVEYLLNQQILHRDIKPGNIFIDMDNEPKLGDFGLAIEKRDLNKASVSGTPNYLAPEILHKRGHSEMSEVWSLGCLVFCMLTGRPPFETDSVEATYQRILHADYGFPHSPVLSDDAQHFIKRCLCLNPQIRPRVSELLCFPWVNSSTHAAGNMEPYTGRYPLMRAKSAGDMLRDMNSNISLHHGRPKSTAAHVQLDNLTIADKSRRKSVGGSHDSGFGSEVDMSRRPAISDRVHRIISDLYSVSDGSTCLVPSDMPDIFINKWVDYTNKRGFACKLSDGSLSVKFNEGPCINWPEDSNSFLHASTPFSVPKEMNLCQLGQLEQDQMDTALQYGHYMDAELADIEAAPKCTSTPTSLFDRPYIIFNHLSADHLVMVLSNGTVQINMLRTREKIVIWKDDSKLGCPCGIAFFSRGKAPVAYRMVPPYEISEYDYRNPRLCEYLGELATVLLMNCDFLNAGRKPTMSTEC